MVALALPWPLVSRPSARSTARPAASSCSTKVSLPLYWEVIGPTFTLTMPRYSSPSISCSSAPGMHGAMRSTSVRSVHASCRGTPTRNSFVNSISRSLRSLKAGGVVPPGQVAGRVDLGRVSAAGYFADEIRPTPHQRPRSLVAVHGQQRPDRPVEPHRVAPPAVVGGDGDVGGRTGDRLPRLGRDQRLVAEADDDGVVTGVGGRL